MGVIISIKVMLSQVLDFGLGAVAVNSRLWRLWRRLLHRSPCAQTQSSALEGVPDALSGDADGIKQPHTVS